MQRERQLGSSGPLRAPQALPEEAGLSHRGGFPTAEENTLDIIHEQKPLGPGTASALRGVQWRSRLPRPLGFQSFIPQEGMAVGFLVAAIFIVVWFFWGGGGLAEMSPF